MSAAEDRITSDTVLRHLHVDSLPGTTVRATRFWLSLGLAALAGRLNTTTTHLEAVEAGEQPLTADQHQHLIDMATAALAGVSRAELRAYREHMGLSQTNLADLLGTNRSTVARAEEGTRAVSPTMVALLERLLPEHATAIATLTEHLRSHAATSGQPIQVLTYAGDEDLHAAQAQLPPHSSHTSDTATPQDHGTRGDQSDHDEDPVTALLRAASASSWHRSVVAAAARAVGARITYATPTTTTTTP